MSELSHQDPTGRFSNLAELYAKHRPDYPPAALDFVIARCGLGPGAVVADVGSGTGISARLLAARGLRVIGIEPNDAMRAKAEAESAPAGSLAPTYQAGRGEATGLANGAVAAVLSAQAFHWFDAPAALREFHRILKVGGWVALLWNERDETDAFTAAYGDVVRMAPEARAVEGPRARAGQPLLESELFEASERMPFGHEQELDEAGLVGRSLSASYAPREDEVRERFVKALHDVFARYQRNGRVVLKYETTVYLARRKG